jgi:Mrp family chromosome partitioning ATPase
LLRTRECSLTVEYFRETYDLVLIDVPALLPVADATVVLPFVDGVILVTMAGRTTKPALRRAREICEGMGVPILGLVVGNLKEALPEYGDGKYYEYYKRKKEQSEDTSEKDADGGRGAKFQPDIARGKIGGPAWGPKVGKGAKRRK